MTKEAFKLYTPMKSEILYILLDVNMNLQINSKSVLRLSVQPNIATRGQCIDTSPSGDGMQCAECALGHCSIVSIILRLEQ